MKAEYIKDNKVYSFNEPLSKDDYNKFYNNELNGKYERDYIPVDNINELKQDVISKIDSFIQYEISKGFEYNGKIYSMSTNAQLNWSNILNIPDSMFPIDIMSTDEKLYSLTLSEKEQFYNTCIAFKYKALRKGHSLKEALKLLNNPDDILSFIIE